MMIVETLWLRFSDIIPKAMTTATCFAPNVVAMLAGFSFMFTKRRYE
jgi:hypothetical protein